MTGLDSQRRYGKAAGVSVGIHFLLFMLFCWAFAGLTVPLAETEDYVVLSLASLENVNEENNWGNSPTQGAVFSMNSAAPTLPSGSKVSNVLVQETVEPAVGESGIEQGMDLGSRQENSGGSVSTLQGNGQIEENNSRSQGQIIKPQILKKTDPVYPERAKQEGQEGRVILNIHVSPAGIPEHITVKVSSGYAVLDAAAVQAVTNWRFVPAKDSNTGKPRACITSLPIEFRLQNG